MSKAQGSAYIEQGQTKAICAVYGPREIPRKSDFSMKGILNCTLERTPFARTRRQASGPQNLDADEEEVSKTLSEALQATVCMVSQINAQCGNYGNLLIHFFAKKFVKATFLLKKFSNELVLPNIFQ